MKETVEKLDFINIKNFCSTEDNVKKNEKTSHTLGENTCKGTSNKTQLFKIYKELLKLNSKKTI